MTDRTTYIPGLEPLSSPGNEPYTIAATPNDCGELWSVRVYRRSDMEEVCQFSGSDIDRLVERARRVACELNNTADWQPIETAPRDGTAILACFKQDIYPAVEPRREDLMLWNGLRMPLRFGGSGMEWTVAAPVGHGGFPDTWIAGWLPLPDSPAQEGK